MKKLEVLHFSSYSTSKKEGSVKVEYLVALRPFGRNGMKSCRGAIHCARIPGRCIGDGRNEFAPLQITRKDGEPPPS
jgi:hypothetical protein